MKIKQPGFFIYGTPTLCKIPNLLDVQCNDLMVHLLNGNGNENKLKLKWTEMRIS